MTDDVGALSPARAEDLPPALMDRPAAPPRRMEDAVRALVVDAAAGAAAGAAGRAGGVTPGLALRMACAAATLWSGFHKFDAADPHWPDRDRVVLSAGDAALLLHVLLYLTGHDGMTLDDLRAYRQPGSAATGHPLFGAHPAVEATTGPPGQGLATAVGMAIAERSMAARFGKSLVDHRTWVIAADTDLETGLGHEAAALAGRLGLAKLAVLHDSAAPGGDAEADRGAAEDIARRFAAYGWATRAVDGDDAEAVRAALSFAIRSKKPTLIVCLAGVDAPGGAPGEAPGEAPGPLPFALPFATPADLLARWRAAGSRGAGARRAWLKRLARHSQRPEFERVLAGRLPETMHEVMAALKLDLAESHAPPDIAAAAQRGLEALLTAVPELLGGCAGADAAAPRAGGPITAGNFGGRHLHWGVRHHAMAAAANGLALHGGVIPCVAAALTEADSLRPALRLAALMRQRTIYLLTQDPPSLADAGPVHQAAEHLAAFRAMPNLHVLRPADAQEVAECWDLALRRADGPSVLVLCREALPCVRAEPGDPRCARGGYIVTEAEGPRQATLIASGAEVAVALAARERLRAEGVAAAVVSLPSWELFALQDASWREGVLGGAPRFGIEAACGFGWERWLGPDGQFIGMTGFGIAAPLAERCAHFGLTADAVTAAVLKRLG